MCPIKMQLRVPAGVFYVSIVASMQEIFRSFPPFPCAAVCNKTSLVSRRSVYLAPQPVGTAKTVQEKCPKCVNIFLELPLLTMSKFLHCAKIQKGLLVLDDSKFTRRRQRGRQHQRKHRQQRWPRQHQCRWLAWWQMAWRQCQQGRLVLAWWCCWMGSIYKSH